ncbi:MAG: S9 family peptidase [Chloroflexi bacterium]|nr:S9 family peptidase [Chloroflexota bacterium]
MGDEELVWTPERLVRYPLITGLDLSPDGCWVVYALRESILTDEESKFVSHLYLAPVDGSSAEHDGQPLRLTYGTASNTMPRWSPDGHYLAFLSDRQDGKRNLYVLRLAGGEAWPLTQTSKDIQTFAWSPDGTQIALTMAPPESESKKKARKAKDDVLRWGVDYERVWLWVLPFVEGGKGLPEVEPLTGDDRHVGRIAWVPEGDKVVFTYQPTPVADDWPQTLLAVASIAQRLETGGVTLRDLGPVAAPDPQVEVWGKWVACTSGVQPLDWTMVQQVRLYPLGGGESRPLAMTADARPTVVGWAKDGRYVYALEASRTASTLWALPVEGGAPRAVLEDMGYISDVRLNSSGRVAFVRQRVDRVNHVCVGMLGEVDGQPASTWREVADPVPTDWPAEAMPQTEIVHWRSGEYEVEGLLTYPLDDEERAPYPMLVIAHGGPMSVFSQTCVAGPALYPTATFAERGFLVLRPNPRGSTGYGPDFRRANLRDWGGGDWRDILAGVDMLVAQGLADPERLGIMGWSYGGYMTSWAITQTDRFRAASVGAGVTNLVSMTGTCDIPSFLPDYMGAEFWDDLKVYQLHSPIFQVKGVRTPTLIQHGREDERVPLSQGKELYNALKRQGVPVQMYIYPRQKHGPDEPRLIMDIVRRNLAWFEYWLMGKGDGLPS